MGRSCCVVGCTNSDRNCKYDKKNNIKFHSLPSKPIEKRQAWISAINRTNPDGTEWQPNSYSYICSEHFEGGQPSQFPCDANYIPTIFPHPEDVKLRKKRRISKITSADHSGSIIVDPTEFAGYSSEYYNNSIKAYSAFYNYVNSECVMTNGDGVQIPTLKPIEAVPVSNDGGKLLDKILDKPEFKVPLEIHGWKREVVFRNSSKDVTRNVDRNKLCDVYYYSPENRKLRSLSEIADYLGPNSHITVNNFSFYKGLIGLSSDMEWTRVAGKSLKRNHNMRPEVDHVTPLSTLKIKKVKKNVISSPNKSENEINGLEMGMLPPDWSSSIPGTPSTNPETSPQVSDCMENRDGLGNPLICSVPQGPSVNPLICSVSCPGAENSCPSLQCASCLCLYHPKCLNLDPRDNYPNYICNYCNEKIRRQELEKRRARWRKSNATRREKRRLERQKYLAMKNGTAPPVITAVPLTKVSPPKTTPHPNPPLSTTPVINIINPNVIVSRPNITFKPRPVISNVKRKLAKLPSVKNTNISPKTNRLIVPSTAISSSNIGGVSKIIRENDRMQSIIQLGYRRFIAVSKKPASKDGASHTQITVPRTKLQPVLPGNQLMVPGNVTTKSPLGGAYIVANSTNMAGVLLPVSAGGTNTTISTPSYYVLNNGQMQAIFSAPHTAMDQTNIKVPNIVSTPRIESSRSVMSHSTNNSYQSSFLNNATESFNVFLQVFGYLSTPDLLRVAEVCRLFQAISRHHTLWKSVDLKNCKIKNWTKCVKFLNKHETEALSLHKMIHPTDTFDEALIWRNLGESLFKASSLKRLDLGICGAPDIGFVTQFRRLTHFSCIFNRKCILDLNIFADLKHLTCLKIRASELKLDVGLKLINENVLSQLRLLKHLSLTSVKHNVQDTSWIDFLKNISPQLESLELGDCTKFTKSFVTQVLSRFIYLKKLRLETVQEMVANDILQVISTMRRLNTLELINYDVEDGFKESFSQCTNIENLLIIPTYIKQSSNTVQIMTESLCKMDKTLKNVVWGFTLELLKVTEMLISQNSLDCDSNMDDYIPILPHVFPLPLPSSYDKHKNAGEVDVLPISDLETILRSNLKHTKISLVKVAYAHTVKQHL